MTSHYEHICFFDFEACTDTSPHQAYCISYALDDEPIRSYYGSHCIRKFLEHMPDNVLCIAHFLTYDFSFSL